MLITEKSYNLSSKSQIKNHLPQFFKKIQPTQNTSIQSTKFTHISDGTEKKNKLSLSKKRAKHAQ